MQTRQGFGIYVVDQELVPCLEEVAAHRFAYVPDPDEAHDGLHARTPFLLVADYRHGPDRRTGRPNELQGRADEVEAMVTRGGQILQYQILDDVDAAAGQKDQMSRHHASDLGIFEPGYVPRHVVRPDREYLSIGEPVRRARRHTRSGEVAFLILPVATVAGPDERHVAEDPGSQNRGDLLDAEFLEAARALDAAVDVDVAEERQGIRLMAKRVYVGPCVLPADDDAGGSGARPCFFRPVLVLVVAVQEVGVAGLPMGGVDGHVLRAGLLEVEDARTDYHAGVLSDRTSSGRTMPPGTTSLRATGCAVGSGRRSGGGFGRPVAGLLRLLQFLREIYILGLRSPRRPDDDQDGAYDQEGERSVLERHEPLE